MNAHTKLLIAGLAALGAMSQYAQAEALPYKDIKLCKGVTLQNDSAKQWGCWTQFAPPAAGPSAVGYLGQPGSEAYLPPVTATQQGASCAAGSVCGYAYYINTNGDKVADGPYPALFTATLQAAMASFQIQPTDPAAPAPLFSYPGSLSSLFSKGGTTIYSAKSGTDTINLQVMNYVSGSQVVTGFGSIYDSSTGATVKGFYVAGVPTSASDLSNLVFNNVSASYSGKELSGNSVNINVNFGTANWNGTWGSGATAWHAAGAVSGGNIQSAAISGYYTGGNVQGTFYGANAQALAGISDVHNATIRHVDVFTTVKN